MFPCQQIGHTARSCSKPAKCGRCSENHETRECKIEQNKFVSYKCALCSGAGHGANFPRCPVRQELVSKTRDSRAGPRYTPPPAANPENFPPLQPAAAPAAPLPVATNPFDTPPLKAAIEGIVAGLIWAFQKDEVPSLSQLIKSLSQGLDRHANVSIHLDQETHQAKLMKTRPLLPTTLPIGALNSPQVS